MSAGLFDDADDSKPPARKKPAAKATQAKEHLPIDRERVLQVIWDLDEAFGDDDDDPRRGSDIASKAATAFAYGRLTERAHRAARDLKRAISFDVDADYEGSDRS